MALIVSGCTSAANAPDWTFGPGPSPSAAAVQSISPTAEPTSPPTAEPTSPPTSSPSSEPTAEPTAAPTAQPAPGPSAAPIGVPPTGIAIYVSEWSVGLPTSLVAGQVNFAITNIGTIQHELLVFKTDLAPSAIPVDKNGDIIQDGPGVTLISKGPKIDPGQTQTRIVNLTQPGKYLFVCNLPGHFMAGMYREVTVTAPSAEQAYVPAALSEWHIAVPPVIKAGTVILEVGNFGTIQHELLIFKTDLLPSQFPLDKNGNVIENGPGITLVSDGDNIDPGATQTRTVDLTQPGTYVFACNIPGHFEAGMYAIVTVTP